MGPGGQLNKHVLSSNGCLPIIYNTSTLCFKFCYKGLCETPMQGTLQSLSVRAYTKYQSKVLCEAPKEGTL